MVNTLWLASWYPSRVSSQNGDFIQRHAQAVALFANVYVLHVVGAENLQEKTETEIERYNNLTEEIVYYRKKKRGIAKGILSLCSYIGIYKKHIHRYIENYGKPDIVHVHVSMRAGLIALWMRRKYSVPYIITEHWTIFTRERKDNFLAMNILFRYLTRKVFKYASAVLPVSNNLGKNIQEMVINVPYTKIPNVVTNNFFYHDHVSNNQPFIFLHVSSLLKIKNPKGIIRAYKNVLQTDKNIILKMVGKHSEYLIEYANNLNIPDDKIIFTGEITNEKVADEMRAANAFILFSESENAPCVISESLCCGVPVIASNVGGVDEMVNEKNSILISNLDQTALESAMKNIMHNYDKYDRKNISSRAIATYNYSKIAKKIIDIYKPIIDTRH